METTIVAIFKAETNANETDPYVQSLKNGGIEAVLLPTLSFNFVNKELLLKHLKNSDNFSGLIFSSSRAVQAVHKAVVSLTSEEILKWKNKNNYCIGESTSKAVNTLLQFNVIGKDTGSSEELCNLILSTASGDKSDQKSNSFLFPCSNIRKDIIPNTLNKNGYKIEEVISYEIVCNPELKNTWKKLISLGNLPSIMIFFSPSGVEFTHELVKDSYTDLSKVRIIAIGKTTEKALKDVNLPACIVSSKPNPNSIFEAVKQLLT